MPTAFVKIETEDCGFIMGRNGVTKNKIGAVSSTKISLDRDKLELEIVGPTDESVEEAKRYCRYVLIQRQGPVDVTSEELKSNCTVVDVPSDCVGLVTGKAGNYMRSIESEWNVLMFFARVDGVKQFNVKPEADKDDFLIEKLCIFGNMRGRRGAELKMMSSVEMHWPGYFTNSLDPCLQSYDAELDFGTEIRQLGKAELGYAMGKKGTTRKKIAASSGAIVEYVHEVAFFAGTRSEIDRAKQYLQWLFDQMNAPLHISLKDRDDWAIVPIPSDCIGFVTGRGRESLSRLEEEKGVLMFFCNKVPKWKSDEEFGGPKLADDEPKDDVKEMFESGEDDTISINSRMWFLRVEKALGQGKSERLYIFGSLKNRVGAQLKLMSMVESKNERLYTEHFSESANSLDEFSIEVMPLQDAEVSFALGRQGQTRKKLSTASNCILEYIGLTAFLAGSFEERTRCRDFLRWLLYQQNSAQVKLPEEAMTKYESILRIVKLEKQAEVAFIRKAGQHLREIESKTGTFIVNSEDEGGSSRLLVFGASEDFPYGLDEAQKQVDELIRHGPPKSESGGWSDYSRGGNKRAWDTKQRTSSRSRRQSPHRKRYRESSRDWYSSNTRQAPYSKSKRRSSRDTYRDRRNSRDDSRRKTADSRGVRDYNTRKRSDSR
jgi:predicted RNA-binding protein Jag